MALADPTVRSQELGEQLSALRAAAGCSLTTAGQRIDASASKICRIENGHTTATPEDVAALLVVYGVTGPHRNELLNLAREAEKRGWWQRHHLDYQTYSRTILNQESKASTIINFELALIPGLLQTREYTRALMQSCAQTPENDIENRINLRQERQALLTQRNPPGFLGIIDELALHRPFGGHEIFRRQLLHILRVAGRPNITVLVVPNNGRTHPGLNGGFMLLRKAGRPSLACTENLVSSLYFEEQAEVDEYTSAVQRLSEHALDQEESRQLIATLAHSDDKAGSPWTECGAVAATAQRDTSALRSPETLTPQRSATPRTPTAPS